MPSPIVMTEHDGDAKLAALEEERDFLLGSLQDLDREYAAGDVDEDDYRTLADDYTARAAEALRAIEAGRRTVARRRARTPLARRVGWIALVAVVAASSGVLVAQASGRRSAGESLTGLDVRAEATRVDECLGLDQAGEADAALSCFSGVLADNADNVDARTFRGWLQVRTGDIDAGIDDLTVAITLSPRATAPLLFRSIARVRQGDPIDALGDLVAFEANGPLDIERELATEFIPTVLDAAIDACIALDVSGTAGTVPLECYTDVLRLDPEHPLANLYLGFLLGKAGFTERALELLDRGLAADPALSQGYVFRAAVRLSSGDVDGAEADLSTFDGLETPADQQAAAAAVRAALAEGRDPFA